MKSQNVLRVINQAIRFHKLPSEILGIKDKYLSFCFDEACDYIIAQLEAEKNPKWSEDKEKKKVNRINARKRNFEIANKLREQKKRGE